jgi:hypothetical protein
MDKVELRFTPIIPLLKSGGKETTFCSEVSRQAEVL